MARYPQAILLSREAPWDENEQLLGEIFRREVRMRLKQFNHLYIFGTAQACKRVMQERFADWLPRL